MEHFTQALQLAQQAMPLSNPNPGGLRHRFCRRTDHWPGPYPARWRGPRRNARAARCGQPGCIGSRQYGVCDAGALRPSGAHAALLRCADRRWRWPCDGRPRRPQSAGSRPGPAAPARRRHRRTAGRPGFSRGPQHATSTSVFSAPYACSALGAASKPLHPRRPHRPAQRDKANGSLEMPPAPMCSTGAPGPAPSSPASARCCTTTRCL